MAIATTTTENSASFDLGGGLGVWSVKVEDDAGTERVVCRLNGQRVRDVTPSGGHVEDRTMATLPSGYEVSVA